MTVDQALDAAEQLTNAGRSVEAERLLLHVLAVQPNHALALHMLAAIAGQSGRMDRALALLSRAAAQTPHDPELLYHLGLASHMSGKYPEAIAAYDAAIALRPEFAEAHSNRAITNLLLGNFEKGLPEYEWRRKSRFANLPSLPPGPVWDGHPPEGKTILLTAEQGLGDTIQFLRYAPLLAASGARVLLAVQDPLMRLAAGITGVVEVLNLHKALPSFDCYAPLLSLPLLAGTRLDSIPAPIPYVQPDPEIAQRWAARIGPRDGKLRVGLVWAGSPANNNDHNRSIAVERLAALATEPNVQFYSLQTGAAAATASDAPPGMHDFTADLSDFAETAGLIAQLDLVITVDTAVLHLAGAMGKPVWAMIPFSPDWRWLMDRTDSPWYPTLRLFRQRFTGDWDSVIAAIAASLNSQI